LAAVSPARTVIPIGINPAEPTVTPAATAVTAIIPPIFANSAKTGPLTGMSVNGMVVVPELSLIETIVTPVCVAKFNLLVIKAGTGRPYRLAIYPASKLAAPIAILIWLIEVEG
jgi:hypothetical protein